LAYVLDAIEQKQAGTREQPPRPLTKDNDQFETLLQHESFAKLYAFAIEKVTPASAELLATTAGEWKKYPQGSSATSLVESLQGHGTGWCTAGESVAASQLSRGDFYVYYSHDEEKNPTIPRAAIRMEAGKIAEVRGIAPNQHLDSYIAPVVQKKMHDFPDGKMYEKKAGDMQRLTQLEQKTVAKKPLSKDDLIFLYEINGKIEGFGYNKDPRIQELRKNRDPKADAPIVMECSPKDIAWSQKEISATTKAYVSPLFKGIFKVGTLEHVYTSFPEGKIRQSAVEISNKTVADYEEAFQKAGMRINEYAKHLLQNMPPLTVDEQALHQPTLAEKVKGLFIKKESPEAKATERIDTVRLTVNDLGFPNGATVKEIYAKANELGLELCPPQVGPERHLKYVDQPAGEWELIAMEPIPLPDGHPYVFYLERNGVGLWLDGDFAEPGNRWHADSRVVFRLRK
jgi:hypothetical protein